MKKIIIALILGMSLLTSGCISATVAGYGVFDLDPGVRIYKTKDTTTVNITHKQGDAPPDYRAIVKLLKGVFE